MRHLLSLAALLALPTTDALACGGFFCRNIPVEQSGEKIVFGIDEEAGKVDVVVQIAYDGPAPEFAWLVPTPTLPELSLAADGLITLLDGATAPRWWVNTEYLGTCDWTGWRSSETGWAGGATADSGLAVDADSGGAGGPTVSVVSRQDVGPYDTVILTATDADDLVTWLQDNAFNVPSDIQRVAAPYVATGSYFVALRLRSDRSVGELRPFALSYPGSKPVIPLVLTSVAAADDMPLSVYVLGDGRAVPTNYLHVQANEAAIDWLANGSNYLDVITRAANEAGGQAFATDSARLTDGLQGSLWAPGRYRTSELRTRTSLGPFMDYLLFSSGFRPSDALLDLLRLHVPMPEPLLDRGVSENDFYNCVSCYPESASIPFDADAFVDDLEEVIVAPSQRADALLRRLSTVTRFSATMSAAEMTLDPQFDLNPSYPLVDNAHEATLFYDCTHDEAWDEAARTLRLPSGREVAVPSVAWLDAEGITASEWLAGLQEPAAAVIEQLFADRDPEPVVDNEDTIDGLVEEFNRQAGELFGQQPEAEPEPTSGVASGCGCASTGTAGGGWWAALGLVALVGRRRR